MITIVKEVTEFDLAAVQQRDLIRAQYHTWDEPRNGLIMAVSKDKLTAIFLPGIHNATCYFEVKAQDVQDGKWTIKLTRDFAEVKEVSPNWQVSKN